MRLTEQDCAALLRVETEVLRVLMSITDDQLEDRAVALDTKRKAQAALLDIAPAFQVRTRPQRPHEEPEVTDGDAFRRAHGARELLLTIERRASARVYRRAA